MQEQTASIKNAKRDVHQEVTDKIISLLEAGTVPWQQLFHNHLLGFAQNFCTGHQYQGINWFLLNFMTNYEAPYFLTWKQIQKIGGRVKKGSKATRIYYADCFYKDEQGKKVATKVVNEALANGKKVEKQYFLRGYSVFNITCVENINWEMPVLETERLNPIERCEAILEQLEDQPQVKFLDNTKAYYRVLFHELVHWTGHSSRLDRLQLGNTPDQTMDRAAHYAEEELVAELGACILAAHLDINSNALLDNSAAYIQHWLNQLKADKHFIFRVASQAQKAVDYILEGKAL